MSIPTEYYEPDFIDFEEFMNVLGNTKESMSDNPHASGDYMLEMFKCYEFFRKNEEKAEIVHDLRNKLGRNKEKKKSGKTKMGNIGSEHGAKPKVGIILDARF